MKRLALCVLLLIVAVGCSQSKIDQYSTARSFVDDDCLVRLVDTSGKLSRYIAVCPGGNVRLIIVNTIDLEASSSSKLSEPLFRAEDVLRVVNQ